MTTDPADAWAVLPELEAVLRSRLDDPPPGSYSATLLSDAEKASRKVMEEAYELCVELLRPEPDRQRIASESADLLFHVLTALVGAGIDLRTVLDELADRRGAPRRHETTETAG